MIIFILFNRESYHDMNYIIDSETKVRSRTHFFTCILEIRYNLIAYRFITFSSLKLNVLGIKQGIMGEGGDVRYKL